MKKWWGIFALLLFLTGCGQAAEPLPEAADDYEALVASTPVAPVEGEAVSPDGRFEVRTEGASGEYDSGIQPPEFLQIIDRETGDVLWQDMGWLSQSVLWSPEGGFVALATSARTWCSVKVIETKNWTSWEFALPDGSPIPEYTFLPSDEPWGEWSGEDSLDLTIGRGGDSGEQAFYHCDINVRDGAVEGVVWAETREPLPGSYDFDHDGKPEIVELVKDYDDAAMTEVWQYGLRVRTEDNRLCWTRFCHTSHAGWGSYFAWRTGGEDFLLRYLPTMYQGAAAYEYQIFSLSETGEELVVRAGRVEFDINFGSPMHDSFDPEAIAAFLEEVHGLLEDSELLLTTENGDFRSGGPGADFRDDLEFWTNDELYDGTKSLAENLRAMGAYWQEMQEAA